MNFYRFHPKGWRTCMNGVGVIFLQAAWDGKQGCVSRDDERKDDTNQVRWQQVL